VQLSTSDNSLRGWFAIVAPSRIEYGRVHKRQPSQAPDFAYRSWIGVENRGLQVGLLRHAYMAMQICGGTTSGAAMSNFVFWVRCGSSTRTFLAIRFGRTNQLFPGNFLGSRRGVFRVRKRHCVSGFLYFLCRQ